MASAERNPAAQRLLIGWATIAMLTLAGLWLIGIRPEDHPNFAPILGFAMLALLVQGIATIMAVTNGRVRLAWIVLVLPQAALFAMFSSTWLLFHLMPAH